MALKRPIINLELIDLPYQLGPEDTLAMSKNIPLLIRTTKNEFAPFMNRYFDTNYGVKPQLDKELFALVKFNQ